MDDGTLDEDVEILMEDLSDLMVAHERMSRPLGELTTLEDFAREIGVDLDDD